MRELCFTNDCVLRAQNGGLFRSPGRGIHPDRIIDTHELIFVRSGSLHIIEEECSYVVRSGETLLLSPGLRHRGARPYGTDDAFYWVHFTLTLARRSRDVIRVPKVGRPPRPDRLAELFHRFLDDQESGPALPAASNALVLLMLCEAARSEPATGTVSKATTSMAGRAAAYVDAHSHLPISARDVAQHLRLNADYLNRSFRRARGMTISEYIKRRRLREARSLLIEGRLSVAEVAGSCGFSELSYFRRLFRAAEGVSPADFRRLYARVHTNVR